MENPFPESRSKMIPLFASLGAFLLAGALFLLIPVTQSFSDLDQEILELREVVTIDPPVMEDIPPPEEMEEDPIEEEVPEMQEDLVELSLSQLELSLNPGFGEALAMGVKSKSFNTKVDVLGDIKKVFVFEDLAQAPRVISSPRISFPRELIRQGIKRGEVVIRIEINEKGRARVLQVLSYTHSQLVALAERLVRQVRFSIPKIEGKPVKVQGEWPITLMAPK